MVTWNYLERNKKSGDITPSSVCDCPRDIPTFFLGNYSSKILKLLIAIE